MIRTLAISLILGWLAAHAIAIPAAQSYAAIFAPINEALAGR